MAGETAHFDGTDIKVSWPPRKVPVVIACTGPKSLQLAGRIADGVLFQVGSDPSLVRYAKKNIELGAKQAGRELSEIKLYQRLACAVSAQRKKPYHASRSWQIWVWKISFYLLRQKSPASLLKCWQNRFCQSLIARKPD